MKKLSYITLGAFLLFCRCGEKESAGDTVTIKFWHSFVASTMPALEELLDRFEAEHPQIKIKAQYIPTGDALIQKLITAVQSKTAPDISWIHADYLGNLVGADAIYDLDHFIKGENGIPAAELADIYPSLIQLASWRKTLYSMPMEATNLGLIYNKDHFRAAGLDAESPPQNWQELHDTALKLTFDKDGDGRFEQIGLFVPIYPSSGPLNAWMVWQWMPFLWQAGGYMINEEQTEVLFNSPAAIQATTLWKNLYDALDMRSFTTDYDISFAANRISMAFDGPWNLPRFAELLKDIDWAVAPLPAGPVKSATVTGGEYLAIFKQSQHPNEAWAFIKWIIQPEIQAFWSMKSAYLPIRKKTLEIPEYQAYLQDHPHLRSYVEQMEYSQAPRPFDFYMMESTLLLAEALERATLGRIDPATALNEAAQKASKLLQIGQ
ncbi:ABC transporter substrate-binding protein [candidate division KSB1 bacterium]|nr:ABC transporter substrate-binding protein [candidate division KSB1 bacterium]RQW06177.1 MAG: ABC transporter substrate-binding protein [candidate division KSB1 bacterium]